MIHLTCTVFWQNVTLLLAAVWNQFVPEKTNMNTFSCNKPQGKLTGYRF